MSLVTDRAEIAAILSTVEGVTGHEYRPAPMMAGAGWPLLDTIERTPEFEVTWRVVVLLPVGERRASEWMDAHVEALLDAFADFGYVERVQPANLATEGGDMDIMILTVRKEA
jgi:hypothetical protein